MAEEQQDQAVEQTDTRRRSLDEWITYNKRVLFWIAVGLAVPYFLSCLGISFMVFRVMTTGGACG